MPTIEVRFSHSYGTGTHAGPSFHRYHPSETDGSVSIRIEPPTGELRIYFRQRGYVTADGFAIHEEKKQELTPEAIDLTAVIHGGWLIGTFVATDVDQELVDELKLQRYGAPRGVAFAKRLLRAVVNPHFVRAANSIRLLTGQYWLEPLLEWNGDDGTLGTYCQHLQMYWRCDDGELRRFYPAVAGSHHHDDGPANSYALLPDRTRWSQIVSAIEGGYSPSLTAMLLLRAHQLKEEGDIRLAYIEAVAAAEIILKETIQSTLGHAKAIKDAAQSVLMLSFKAQLAIVSAFLGISRSDIELSLRAYDIRCLLAHEGLTDVEEGVAPLEALLRLTVSLLPEPRPVHAVEPNSNERRDSSEEWERVPGRKYRMKITTTSIPPGFLPWDPDTPQ